jgi:chromosome segregation protein
MKIKKLEMVGFKSFVDRTVVNFDHEVLGIVGPNGCGKSNIVDAIRWCMGEQSAKHLRGRSMEDVIFNGSETRAAHEFAEVTLTFDNDDPAGLPLEYKDYAEIAVTRRLTRAGDSDYLINKTPVRLKDVTELFLGTGAGTKAYSIVEQGKIGLIVSAKPEDRRMLIEEAAGITKFKSRKKQAERKMELTQQNLLRVGDIIAEIERNIGSLKRQAAKAERYITYRNELEDLQLYEAAHKWLEHSGWVKLERAEVERLGAESDAARSALAAREAELEAVRLEAHASEEELEKAHNASFAAENEVRAEEAHIARGRDRLEALGTRETQVAREQEEMSAQQRVLDAEREAVSKEVCELESDEAAQARAVEEEEARLAELGVESDATAREAAGVREAMGRAQSDIATATVRLEGFEQRHADVLARLEKLHRERTELEEGEIELSTRAEQLGAEVRELRSGRVTTAEQKQRYEERLAELRIAITESDRALDEAKADLSRARSRLHALEEVHGRLEGVGAGVKALLAMRDETVCGLVADRLEAPHELVPALAGLLGHRLEDVVVRDVERGAHLLAELASGHKGRATIMPLRPRHVAGAHYEPAEGATRLVDELRYADEDEALVQSLVGDAIVVADLAAARALTDHVYSAPIVTLDGTVLFPDGSIAGGTGEEVAVGMLETKREMRELGLAMTRLDARANEALAAHHALRQAISETQGALDAARQKEHQGELAIVHAEKDLRACEAQLDAVRRRAESLAAETSELEARLEVEAHEQSEARRMVEEASGVLADLVGKLDAAEKSAAEWRERVEAQRARMTERKVRAAGTGERLSAAKGTLGRLARSTGELAERTLRLEEELRAGARAFGEAAGLIVVHKTRLEVALDAARLAQDALAAARRAFESFRADLQEREAHIKDLRNHADAVRESLGVHEMSLRERELALGHLLEGVAERFRGLHLPRVVGDYHLRPPPDDETRARIHELSHLIDRMGSVNLDAVREHEEAEKRYAFYSEQKADLDKALADLARAIQQMNRESRKLFQETFEAVNERFQEIFPRMFRGGRASLRLTNPDDLLETGIDILAQPPGKKLSSIELMSGGEKALTAVSLIFAIFQIRPSPFCILDEVDAPLDEANVARYNDLVRSMTDRSQFILITHVKRTMQVVDVLYGVTMQELGVSRIVSVKINEAAGQRARPVEAAAAVA